MSDGSEGSEGSDGSDKSESSEGVDRAKKEAAARVGQSPGYGVSGVGRGYSALPSEPSTLMILCL